MRIGWCFFGRAIIFMEKLDGRQKMVDGDAEISPVLLYVWLKRRVSRIKNTNELY